MVLFPNDTLTLYYRGTPVRNGEGITTSYAYTLYKAVRADIQVGGGGPVGMELYGLSNLQADDRVAFVDSDAGIRPIMKAVSTNTGRVYEVVQDTPWPNHTLIVLRPMQAGQVQ